MTQTGTFLQSDRKYAPTEPSERRLNTKSQQEPGLNRWIIFTVGLLAISAGTAVTFLLSRLNALHQLPGILQAETFVLRADSSGFVQQVLTKPGQRLHPGEKVLVFRDTQLEQALQEAQQQVAACRAALERAKADAQVELAWRKKRIQDERLEIELQIAASLGTQYQSKFEELAWKELFQGPKLTASDSSDEVFQLVANRTEIGADLARMIAALKEEKARNRHEVAQAQIELCEQRLKELNRLEKQLPKLVQQAAGVGQAEADLQKALQRLKQLQSQGVLKALKTPTYATVAQVTKHPGDQFQKGEPLVKLLDTDRCFITVEVPTSLLTHLQLKKEVRIEFPGGVLRTGRIAEVPVEAKVKKASNKLQATVTVRINPSGKLWPNVPIGTAVRVTL